MLHVVTDCYVKSQEDNTFLHVQQNAGFPKMFL